MNEKEKYFENCGGITVNTAKTDGYEAEVGKNTDVEQENTEALNKDTAKENDEPLNKDTELVFIIDESGSMSGYGSDTVGGFNSMIKKQRDGEGRVYVSTVLFNTSRRVIHDRVDIESVEDMTENDYSPRGCTALLDAIGASIRHISNIHKYARKEDVPANTVFVITTDGLENSSCKYGADEVRDMIKKKTEENGWEFIFVAANIDAVKTAGSIGIREERAANYRQSVDGIADCYEAMSMFVTKKRKSKKMASDDCEWKQNLF